MYFCEKTVSGCFLMLLNPSYIVTGQYLSGRLPQHEQIRNKRYCEHQKTACRHNAQRNADEQPERRVHNRITHAHERKHDEVEHDIPYHVVRERRQHLLEQKIAPVHADRAINAVFLAVSYAPRLFYKEPHDEQQREHDEEYQKIVCRLAHDLRVLPLVQRAYVDAANTEPRERTRKAFELFPALRLYLEIELRRNARRRGRTFQRVDIRLQGNEDVGQRFRIDVDTDIRIHHVARDLEPLHIHRTAADDLYRRGCTGRCGEVGVRHIDEIVRLRGVAHHLIQRIAVYLHRHFVIAEGGTVGQQYLARVRRFGKIGGEEQVVVIAELRCNR